MDFVRRKPRTGYVTDRWGSTSRIPRRLRPDLRRHFRQSAPSSRSAHDFRV